MAHKRYLERVYQFENAIEVEVYGTGNYGAPGERRMRRKKPTSEEMAKRNQWRKEKKARHQLRKYFCKNDYFVQLTYQVKDRPASMAVAKEHFRKFCRKARAEYKKRGYDFLWLRNIEVGTKGAWHIHMIVKRIPDADIIMADNWLYGKVVFIPMYQRGEFRNLAAYITKTPRTDPRLKESIYSASRNMPLDPPKEKEYMIWKPWKKVKIPAGFQLDQETLQEGQNPFTGKRYRMYTLLRIRKR